MALGSVPRRLLTRTFGLWQLRNNPSCGLAVSRFYHKNFYLRDLQIRASEDRRPPKRELLQKAAFGEVFTDLMLEVDWDAKDGWRAPVIRDFGPIELHPAAKCLHYASEVFEGVKAFRGDDGKVRVFRLDRNSRRMLLSAARAGLPLFSDTELTKLIVELVRRCVDWFPEGPSACIYIRPTLIGTEESLGVKRSKNAKLFVILAPTNQGYYGGASGEQIALLADPRRVRAFPGGAGSFKLGSNYAPTIVVGEDAVRAGCSQVLWLFGPEERLTEVGTMNVFLHLRDRDGTERLVTPPADTEAFGHDLILPGITRDSLLQLARESEPKVVVEEREVTMAELRQTIQDGRLVSFFGSGTAAVVSPVSSIKYFNVNANELEEIALPLDLSHDSLMVRLQRQLLDIQYGRVHRPEWTTEVPL